MSRTHSWTIPGFAGFPLCGTAHAPSAPPRGIVLLIHGFLGYKDYGFFPFLAARLADAGFIAHRFNLSHSGMTENVETFERPGLFEQATWNRNIADIHRVIEAAHRGDLPGDSGGRPIILYGHSRGGLGAIMAAGRRFAGSMTPTPAGVISVAAPSRSCHLDEQEQRDLLERGWMEVRSNRTGQTLRLGSIWLQDQIDDPEGHDVPRHVAALRCPLLLIHGADDATVPPACAEELASYAAPEADVSVEIVPKANHVFNTRNPFPQDGRPPAQLERLRDFVVEFSNRCTAHRACGGVDAHANGP